MVGQYVNTMCGVRVVEIAKAAVFVSINASVGSVDSAGFLIGIKR
jgi:hypothetical protein